MDVDGGNLQIIDIDVMLENCPITLFLYGTHFQVANMVFIIHTISYIMLRL